MVLVFANRNVELYKCEEHGTCKYYDILTILVSMYIIIKCKIQYTTFSSFTGVIQSMQQFLKSLLVNTPFNASTLNIDVTNISIQWWHGLNAWTTNVWSINSLQPR